MGGELTHAGGSLPQHRMTDPRQHAVLDSPNGAAPDNGGWPIKEGLRSCRGSFEQAGEVLSLRLSG